MRRLLLAAALLLPSPGAAADFTRNAVGTMGSEFLTMDQGARGIGMGGAYSAVTNDATSVYWNPAGLTRVPRLSATFMYSRYVQGVSYQSAYVASRLNDTSVIAGGWRYRDVGPIDNTDINGTTLGTFSPKDYVAEVGWGQSILDLSDSEVDVTMGVTGRLLHSDYIAKADSLNGDVGIQSRFYTSRHAYDLSFVAQNVGQGQKFDQRRDPLPFRAKLGAATSPIKPLTVSMEAIFPSGNVMHGALGAEYAMDMAPQVRGFMRGGLNTLTMDSLGFASIMSFGWGVAVGDLSFDYAFVPMGVLGTDTHKISLSFNLPARVSRRYRER